MSRKIYIVAGEVSGDNHGSGLMKAIRSHDKSVQFSGVGGPCMEKISKSIRNWTDDSAVVGFWEVIKKYRFFKEVFDQVLDEIERTGQVDLPGFSSALVIPAAEKLSDREGGCAYLRIAAELVNSYRPRVDPIETISTSVSLNRWRAMVEPSLSPLAVDPLHRRFTARRIMLVELARRAESPRRKDDRLFASHLIDLVTAILGAPISDQTSALLAERARG